MNPFESEQYCLGFLASAIDGEGSIYIEKKPNKRMRCGYQYLPVVQIYNSSLAFLEKIKDIVGGGYIRERQCAGSVSKGGVVSNSNQYYYYMPLPLAREILPKIRLVIKERQRCLVIKALELTSKRKPHTNDEIMELERIFQKVKKLNARKKLLSSVRN